MRTISLFLLSVVLASASGKLATTNAKEQSKINTIVEQEMAAEFSAEKKIDLSGKQRMLTQRISELVLEIYLDIDREDNTKALVETTQEFAQSLKKLKDSSQREQNVLAQISLIETEWNTFIYNIKELLFKGKKRAEGLRYIIGNEEKLLNMSNDLVIAYKMSNDTSVYLDKYRRSLIDMAGRQRMLTLKMLKDKMLIYSGEKSRIKQLNKSIKLFDDSLNAIIHGDKTLNIVAPENETMKKQLRQIKAHWKILRPQMEKDITSKSELRKLILGFHTLLKESNEAVQISTKVIEY